MPDQTIALQLNIDTNAPDAIDQLKQKIAELQDQVDTAAAGSKAFTDAFANLSSAKELLGQLSGSFSSISPQMDDLTKGALNYNTALADIGKNASGIDGLAQAMDAINPDPKAAQFTKFGQTASDALKGVGAAATLAAQNSSDLEKMVENATTATTKAGSQTMTTIQQNHAQELQESDAFHKSMLASQANYQSLELSATDTTAKEKKKIQDAEFSAAQSSADALGALADLMVENGKKNTDAQKATALIKIGIDTASAISSLVAAANENPANAATSGIAGAAQFAVGIAEILTNIAKAKDILSGADAGSAGSSSAPATGALSSNASVSAPVINTQPQNPAGTTTINRTTQGNSQQTGMIKAYVVESDITNAQQRAATLKSQSLH